MAVPGWQLSRFERILFWAAITLAGLLVLARIGTMLMLTILRHFR